MEFLQIILVMVIFLSLMVEIKTGGMGVGALLGLVAAGIFWTSAYSAGNLELYQVGLFMLGLLLIVIELLTPTVGLLGALGVGSILYSLVLAMGGNIQGIYFLLIALIGAIIIFGLIVKKLPSSKLWQKIVLTKSSRGSEGYVASSNYDNLLGSTGSVLTELRPAGTALIQGAKQDVISAGEYIAKDKLVEVVKVEGNRIIVREI